MGIWLFLSIRPVLTLRRLTTGRRKGTSAVEYALLLALVVLTAVGTWAAFSQTLQTALQDVVNCFTEVGNP